MLKKGREVNMGRHDKKLGFLMHQKINGILCIGQSKHLAKNSAKAEAIRNGVRKYNPAKLTGIYSIKTIEAYRQTTNEFCRWYASMGYRKYVRNLEEIPRERVIEYLKYRDSESLSAWTVSKDMAALNKIFGYDITKKEADLKARHLEDIKRSRMPVKADMREFAKYQDAIFVARATGMRKQSVTKIKPEDFIRAVDGKVIAVNLIEKGGRPRIAPVLQCYQEKLTQLINNKVSGKPMFPAYDKNIRNHKFRAEYATKLYAEKLSKITEDNLNKRYIYRGFDGEIVEEVSKALGHNRLNVVVEHYLYNININDELQQDYGGSQNVL